MTLPGAFLSTKKDGSIYYRASFTYKGKHISLGSYSSENEAHEAYLLAQKIVNKNTRFYPNHMREIEAWSEFGKAIDFDKWVMLLNLRDNGMYCRNPIYLQHRFFYYCLDSDTILRFDIEELFYYMNHKLQKRGNHLFVADYGMQVNILSRYGIKNYGVPGRDYFFVNEDPYDFRSGNIEIVNPYHGVRTAVFRGNTVFVARIHINGDYVVGRYASAEEAATAYNKAADYLEQHGIKKHFPRNYIEDYDDLKYAGVYQRVRINKKLKTLVDPRT